MGVPCEQEATILNINKTLDRVERTLERVVVTMEKVAEQSARLDSIEDRLEHISNDAENLFTRLRDVELNQAAYGPEARIQFNNVVEEVTRKLDDVNTRLERLLRFYRLTTGRYAMYGYGIVLVIILLGLVSDIYNHYAWVKAVFEFFK